MMRCDAEWLKQTLAGFPNEELSPLVNLGSSTRHFREIEQPFIDELIFKPLRQRGIEIIHSDLKSGEGVDISGDIFDDSCLAAIKARQPKAVLCTHMFEHVTDRGELARRLTEILPSGGILFVTVPYSYHEHNDPIDTMYRPSPDKLASMFTGYEILSKQELIGGTYWDHIRRRPLTLLSRHILRFFAPFLGIKKWKRSMKKLYWLFHPYKVSAVVGRKR